MNRQGRSSPVPGKNLSIMNWVMGMGNTGIAEGSMGVIWGNNNTTVTVQPCHAMEEGQGKKGEMACRKGLIMPNGQSLSSSTRALPSSFLPPRFISPLSLFRVRLLMFPVRFHHCSLHRHPSPSDHHWGMAARPGTRNLSKMFGMGTTELSWGRWVGLGGIQQGLGLSWEGVGKKKAGAGLGYREGPTEQ